MQNGERRKGKKAESSEMNGSEVQHRPSRQLSNIRFYYPRDAMLARVIGIATCLSLCLSVCPSGAGIVSKRRKLAA